MKYIVLFLALFIISIQAQDMPSGYTIRLGLRLYDLDDYPGADSLNANAWAIDNMYGTLLDSLNAAKTDLYNIATYAGVLKNAIVGSANLTTALDTGLVKTTGTDYIYGIRYNLGATNYFKHVFPNVTDTYRLGSLGTRWESGCFKNAYADSFRVTNPIDTTEYIEITYDGSVLSLNGPVSIPELQITDNFAIPDSAAFNAVALSGNAWTPNTGDTVFTVATPVSSIIIRGSNSVAGWDSIDASSWAGNEQIIVFTNQRGFTTAVQDSYPTDGNIILGLAGAYSMGENGIIAFKYNSSLMAWVELYRNGL